MIFNRSHTNQNTTATKIQIKELEMRNFKEQDHKKSNQDIRKRLILYLKFLGLKLSGKHGVGRKLLCIHLG